MTKRLTEAEFFVLPEAERTRLLDLEFKAYIRRDVCERAKTMQASTGAGGSGGSAATDGRSLDERGGMKRA